MKTKALLLTAVLGIAGAASTLAQSNTNYSQNLVGYVSLSFQTGFSMIADPLLGVTNDAQSILTNVPNGSVLYMLNSTTTGYVSTTNQNGVWTPLDDGLNPGGGALLYLPSSTNFKIGGTVPEGNLSNAVPAGLSIQSLLTPVSASLTNSAVNFPVAVGDTIYSFDSTSGQFVVATYYDGQFQPADFVPTVGESFFVLAPAATNWTLYFEAQDVTPNHWSNRNGYSLGLDASPGGFAQGTVNFCNLAGSILNQPVLASGGGPLDPAGIGHFVAELSAGTNATSLAVIPSSITSISNGMFFGGSVTIPGATTNGVALQVLVWDQSAAPDYATAVAAGAATGESSIFSISVSLADYPWPPATMSPLTSFVVKTPGVSTNLGKLTILHSGTNVVLSWPAATNALLQKSIAIQTTNWVNISSTLGLGTYTEPVSTTNTFYRTIAK